MRQGADKAMRAEVDVLTLTATPIPRTWHGARRPARPVGDRDRPQRRLAIKTFVRNEGWSTIREAALREPSAAARSTSCTTTSPPSSTGARPRRWCPRRDRRRPRQMPERELERVMRDFVAQRFNVRSARPSSRPASRRAPTPSSSPAPTARPGAAPAARPVGCLHHQACYLMVPDVEALTRRRRCGSTRSRWRSSAPASTWRCTTSRSAAPARCSRQPERQHDGSRLPLTTTCWPRRCGPAGRELTCWRRSAVTEINLHCHAAA